MENKKVIEYHCDYCQEQDLKKYKINFLGDVFCDEHCEEQMKQFYKGDYEIVFNSEEE